MSAKHSNLNILQTKVAAIRSELAIAQRTAKSKEELEPLVTKLRRAREEMRLFAYNQKPAFTASGHVIRR